MWSILLALSAVAVATVDGTSPAGGALLPGDHAITLRHEDAALDGLGPSRRFTLTAPGAGTLYVSVVDGAHRAFVRVTPAGGGRSDAAGCVAWTPAVTCAVDPTGAAPVVTVSACEALAAGESLDLTLRIGFAEDGPPALDAEARVRRAIDEAHRLRQAGDAAGALRTIEAAARAIAEDPDLVASRRLALAVSDLAALAYENQALDACLASAVFTMQHLARFLPPDHPVLSAARSRVGVAQYAIGRLAEARATFERLLLVLDRTVGPTDVQTSNTTGNLAAILLAEGDVARARTLFERVANDRASRYGPSHASTLEMRGNLAAAMFRQGDVEAALALGEQTLAAQEATLDDDDPGLLSTRVNVALFAAASGDLDRPYALLSEVEAIRAQSLAPTHPELLTVRSNLASSCMDRGQFAEAAKLREAVLAGLTATRSEDHADRLAAMQNLGLTRYAEGRLDDALALFLDSEARYERTVDADDERLMDARRNRSVLHVSRGEPDDARALLETLVASATHRARAALLLPPRVAERHAARDASVVGAVLAFPDIADADLVRDTFGLAATLSMLASGTTTLDGRSAAATRAARDAVVEARRLVADRVLQQSSAEASSATFRDELLALTNAKDAAEARLVAELAARGGVAEPLTAASLAATLRPKHAIVLVLQRPAYAIVPGGPLAARDDAFTALALTQSGRVTRIELGSAERIERAVAAWRAAVELGALDDPAASSEERARARELAELVVEPLRAALPDAAVWHVVWDGVLHAIAPEALPLADGSPFGDHVRVVLLPSFAQFVAPRPTESSRPTLLAVGGVDFGAAVRGRDDVDLEARDAEGMNGAAAAFAPLPNTVVETATIAELFRRTFDREPTIVSGAEASKMTFADAVAGAQFIHVATHGWFAPDAIRSQQESMAGSANETVARIETDRRRAHGLAPGVACGLAFAGANRPPDAIGRNLGLLTAEELAGLDLSQCSLCVLSACESNVGIRRMGLGMRSLQAAVHAAGARCAITTLWAVDDAATRNVMERFYDELWTHGSSASEALWRAKKELRERGAPTAHWAGFVLSGDPDAR